MADIQLLKKFISDSGIPLSTIAKRANIKRCTMYSRLNGKGDFTAFEIVGLTDALKLSKADRERIFFANKVSQDET